MKPLTQQMIGVLRTTIRALGLTNREVEKRLGVSRGYLSRLFAGSMDLRFDHVAEIAEVVGVDAEEIVRLAFPPQRKPESPEAARVREALGIPVSAVAPEDASPEPSALEKELERLVARTFEKMLYQVRK